MNGAAFDRIVRAMGTRLSRRGALAAATVAALGARRAVSANQLTPPTCGASGDVCTMLMGCCDGLTCITSAINVNYGVCVAGEGGTVSIGTTLISPFSENVEQEVAAIAASDTSSTTATTDPTVEREQRLAEIKARKDARRSEQKTRRTTKQNEQQTRRDDQQERRELRRGPRIELELFVPNTDTDPEILRVTNRDDESITLIGIESVPPLEDAIVNPPKTLLVGQSFQFRSGDLTPSPDTSNNRFSWINQRICSSSDGFAVIAAFSATSENFKYTIFCDESEAGPGTNDSTKKRRRKKKNKN